MFNEKLSKNLFEIQNLLKKEKDLNLAQTLKKEKLSLSLKKDLKESFSTKNSRFKSNPNKGESLFLSQRIKWKTKVLVKRNPKGFKQHNPIFSKKMYLQKILKILYGHLSQKTFKLFVSRAKKYSSNEFGAVLLSLLERKMDVVLYRSNLCLSLSHARHLLSHQKIFLNGIRVTQDFPFKSYLLKDGDLLSIDPEAHEKLKELLKQKREDNFFLPKASHLESCFKTLTTIFLFSPQQIFHPMKLFVKKLEIFKVS